MKWKLWGMWAAALPSLASAAGFECLIEAAQVVEVRSSVDGVISTVHVQRGALVRKGQVLVELNSTAERLAVESARFRSVMDGQITTARNRLDFATKKMARAVDLQQQNFVSAQARDEAEAERRLAESELQVAIENRDLAKIEHRRAVEQLALRTIVSPLNGVVIDRLLNPGDLAESGSGRKPVLKVAQIDPLRVDVVLPGAVFGQLKPGMKASVLPHGGTVRYTTSVKLVDKLIDAASGTFVARLDLPNPNHALPGGARCTVEIEGVMSGREAVRPKP